jgi:hypothetical protein
MGASAPLVMLIARHGSGAAWGRPREPRGPQWVGVRARCRSCASEGGWRTLVALTRETSYHDPTGVAGSRYRLSTVNGLGGGAGSIRVELYDLRARRVRVLADAPYTAGYQSTTWDGRDDSGHEVGSGVYFLWSHRLRHDTRLRIVVVR